MNCLRKFSDNDLLLCIKNIITFTSRRLHQSWVYLQTSFLHIYVSIFVWPVFTGVTYIPADSERLCRRSPQDLSRASVTINSIESVVFIDVLKLLVNVQQSIRRVRVWIASMPIRTCRWRVRSWYFVSSSDEQTQFPSIWLALRTLVAMP